jgi:hypothetical protein
MQIPIAVSKKMEQGNEVNQEVPEIRLIRIPADLRELMGVELYTFLTLQTKTGESISLIVEKAYKEDAEVDPLKAYLAGPTFSLLSESTEQDVELCEEITLGCDPELLIINSENGMIIDAHKIFRKWNPVGSDGLLLELRPMPSQYEEVVVGNLFLQLIEARKVLSAGKSLFGCKIDGNKCALLSRSYYSPIGKPVGGQFVGFHIHFGLPQKLLVGNYNNVLKSIVRLLDYYIGIPAILIEGEHDNVRRCQSRILYGKPGDWRRGAGNVTLEYRVPGGALMKTPEAALGILSIGGLVMEDIISRLKATTNEFAKLDNNKSCSDLRDLYPSLMSTMDICSIICSPSISPAKDTMSQIYSDFEKMVGFAKRKKAIDLFLKIVSDPLKISEFVEKNWRVFYEQRQSRPLDILQQSSTAGAVS